MTERLSQLDVSFLYMETSTTAMHVGGVAIFQPPEQGFDHDGLLTLIAQRIALVPRYRQKLQQVPGRLANPVWVDDQDFDVAYHVRRSALPAPGGRDQLRELVGRLQSRQLDRSRPLWEIYLVEGLADDQVAIITKTHHAMVDGLAAIDIGTVILDATPEPRAVAADDWTPAEAPSPGELVAGAVLDYWLRPTQALEAATAALQDAQATAHKVAALAGGVLAGVRTISRPAPPSPLNVKIGGHRRFAMAATDLDDYKRVRKFYGTTINDVVLATVAGALRSWLMSRGEPVTAGSTVRAMVPVSVRAPQAQIAVGNHISSYFVDLAVGQPDPAVRLRRVSREMRGHKESGQAVGADALVQMSGFAPPTVHALGARLVSSATRRLFNLVVTNVPGPQFALYAAGAQMMEMYPVVPLAKGQALAIGLTSYNGAVYFGLNSDRDAMPDVDLVASLLTESLAELVATVA